MFDRLKALFEAPDPYQTPLPKADAEHALGALMVRAAKADRLIVLEEWQAIDQFLAQLYDLGPVEAAKMRASCEILEREMPDTAEMTALVRDAISLEDREEALIGLWRVVYADGVKHEDEDALLHHIEEVLGIAPARAKELQARAK